MTDAPSSSTTARAAILGALRGVQRPFPDAAPQPERYQAVTVQPDESPAALLHRFTRELTNLKGEVFIVADDAAARERVGALLDQHGASSVLAWDFRHIPLPGLADLLADAGIRVLVPDVQDEFRQETLSDAGAAPIGLTGADAAAATTGTLIVTSGPGKGRLPTILPPVHLVVLRQSQIIPRIEHWVAAQRADGLTALAASANAAFITGPSRTGDIEMELILGVHGPGRVQVVIIADQTGVPG